MEIPQIKFTKWYKWSDRKLIENSDDAGVYVLAKFSENPRGQADLLNKNIIYCGETSWLKRRLDQFSRSAFETKDGHSGGWTYNEVFSDDWRDLYISSLIVPELPDNLKLLFVRYVERKIILDFALKHGSQPKLNKK